MSSVSYKLISNIPNVSECGYPSFKIKCLIVNVPIQFKSVLVNVVIQLKSEFNRECAFPA